MYWSSCLSKSSLLTGVAPPRPPRPRPRPDDWPRGVVWIAPPRCWPLPPRPPRPLPRPRPRWTWFSTGGEATGARPPRLAPLMAPRARGDFVGVRFVVVATGAAFLVGEMTLPRVLRFVPGPPRVIVWLTICLGPPRPPRPTLTGLTDCVLFPRWLPRPATRLVVVLLWFCVSAPRNRLLVFTEGVAPRRCFMLFCKSFKNRLSGVLD